MIARVMSAMSVGVALLSGCGAANAAAMRPAPEAECSFRSATTCWTLAGRFPAERGSPPPASPEELRAPPRAVLASTADSATARP